MRYRSAILTAGFLSLALALTAGAIPAFAQSTNTTDLQKQIEDHNKQIAELDNEIAQYQKQLDTVSTQKKTLQGTVTQLDTSIKKTNTSIQQTQTKISATQLQLQQLGLSIDTTQSAIKSNKSSLAESLALLDMADKIPLAVQAFSADDISDAWQDMDSLARLQDAVQDHIDVLAAQKHELDGLKTETEGKKQQLVSQRSTLVSQKGSLSATKQAKTELLDQTKAKESEYQKILGQKKAARAAFESALTDLKSKLQYTVDQSAITPAGKGVLEWPVDTVKITQYFGNTAFAQSGAYKGKGHNGMDFGIPIGTPIKTALTGIVQGTGNTDLAHGANGSQCYSFGKWVLVKHNNGLSTMYAHLSKISVSQGQSVTTGDIIGYSGETGYATGPHLHFGVYVSSATQVMKLGDATQSSTPCAGAYMPIAPLSGYLNPINYLPS